MPWYVVEIPELLRLGANDVIPEEFETSIEIFARVLAHYGVAPRETDRLVEQIRASHYQALRGGAPGSDSLRLGTVAGIPQIAGRIRLASESDLVGKSLAESGLRTRTGALVLSISRGSDNIASPDPQFELAAGDVLVVVGQPGQLEAARELANGRVDRTAVAVPPHQRS